MIPLMGNVQNRQIHRHREWVPGCQGLGQEDGGMLMEMGFLPGAMEGSKISSSDQCTNKGTACLGQMSCMVRELYLNNAVNREFLGGVYALTAEGLGSIPGQGAKIPQVM